MPKKPEQRFATHGLATNLTSKDGVYREISMFCLNDGAVGFRFLSFYDGKDAEPMNTELTLTKESYNAVAGMMDAIQWRRNEFAIPKAPEKRTKKTKPQPE